MSVSSLAMNIRRPSFMEQAGTPSTVVSPAFAFAPAAAAEPRVAAARLRVLDPAQESAPAVPPPEELHLQATMMAPSAAPAAGPVVDLSRLDAAVDRLRMLSERLAVEARADALEVALLVARKIVEGELTVNADRLLHTVRSAVRRLGESRRIVIRVSPADAELLQGKGPGARTPADVAGSGAARVELVGDPALGRGDCLVEGDLGSVDARLDTRFDEMRRALARAALEDQG